MTIWGPDPFTLISPLHASLALAIARAISDGKLEQGAQLPTHRKMADDLGLSVHTASKPYESLRRQKLIDGQVGRGSYVLDPDKPNDQPFLLSSERGGGFACRFHVRHSRSSTQSGSSKRRGTCRRNWIRATICPAARTSVMTPAGPPECGGCCIAVWRCRRSGSS